MMELLDYQPAYLEDLAIGTEQRQVRLQGQRAVMLTQIHLGVLLPYQTYYGRPGVGTATLSIANALRAGYRVWGVTAYITKAFGRSQALESLLIGDADQNDRWGDLTSLSSGTESDQGNFHNSELKIYAAAEDVIITAVGGLFDGVGEIEVQVHAHPLRHRRHH